MSNTEISQFLSTYHVELLSVVGALLLIAAILLCVSISGGNRTIERLNAAQESLDEYKAALASVSQRAVKLDKNLKDYSDRLDKTAVERDNARHNLGIMTAECDSLKARLGVVLEGAAENTKRRLAAEDECRQLGLSLKHLDDETAHLTNRHNALHRFAKAHTAALTELAETGLFDHEEFFGKDEEVDTVAQWIEENENEDVVFLPLELSPSEDQTNFRAFIERTLNQYPDFFSLQNFLNPPNVADQTTATETKFVKNGDVVFVNPLNSVHVLTPQVRPA